MELEEGGRAVGEGSFDIATVAASEGETAEAPQEWQKRLEAAKSAAQDGQVGIWRFGLGHHQLPASGTTHG